MVVLKVLIRHRCQFKWINRYYFPLIFVSVITTLNRYVIIVLIIYRRRGFLVHNNDDAILEITRVIACLSTFSRMSSEYRIDPTTPAFRVASISQSVSCCDPNALSSAKFVLLLKIRTENTYLESSALMSPQFYSPRDSATIADAPAVFTSKFFRKIHHVYRPGETVTINLPVEYVYCTTSSVTLYRKHSLQLLTGIRKILSIYRVETNVQSSYTYI